jgi:hypothetical protein
LFGAIGLRRLGLTHKRNDKTGRFMDVKADLKPFKGVTKEK